MENTSWQLNHTDTGYLDVQCTGLGGGELEKDWEVLLACRKEAHVYGPSLSKQDDWKERAGTIAGTAHTQKCLLLHLAMFPIGLHTWCHVLGVPDAHQLQAQIILRAKKVLEFCPITPAHSLHGQDTKSLKLAGYMDSLFLRGHSAGSYAGMVWETILAEFPSIEGRSVGGYSPATVPPHEINAVLQQTSTPHPPC